VTSVGLTTTQAQEALAEHGPNEVVVRGRAPAYKRVLTQLRDPLIVVLLSACVLTVATGDFADAVVIAFVVLINTTVGVVQEVRADRSMTALQALAAPHVRVVRDGVEVALPSADIVVGDVVVLSEGDIVPADGVVIEQHSVLVDESAMTGESVPVGKRGTRAEDLGDEVLSGTVIVKGRCRVEVTRTGGASALGKTAALMAGNAVVTPLQKRLNGLGRILALVVITLSVVVVVRGLLRGEPLELMLVTGISLAVAAIPESLPAVVTLSLALGARRMVARHAIVRRLPAVETLGSVSVLATDKTGTLTQGRMQVSALWVPGEAGPTLLDEVDVDQSANPEFDKWRELLIAAALCNDAAVEPDGRVVTKFGDPTDVALTQCAHDFGVVVSDVRGALRRVHEIPFDAATQYMATVHELSDRTEAHLVVVKGSPEAVIKLLPPGSEREDMQYLKHADAMAALGLRVLAVAQGQSMHTDGRCSNLQLLGMTGLLDPPKDSARRTIDACRQAGITPVLITGDHPATARAVAERVGIVESTDGPEVVALGSDVGILDDVALLRPRVFARATPEQKVAIITAWRADGAIVAMTGDGVNDGPALRRADIGIAMGHRGTEVARQAADLVLADDELGTVVAAVEEGRRVYTNIRRFLVFGLSGGAAEIALMLIGPAVGLVVPLVASQILWINLLTHGLTGVALGAEPADPGAMRRPPRPADQSVLGGGVWQRIAITGVLLTFITLGIGVISEHRDLAWQSMIFVTLTAVQLGVALGLRNKLFTKANPFLPLAVLGSFALALAGVYVPWLRDLLSTEALSAAELAACMIAGLVAWACVSAMTRWRSIEVPRASTP
jgi:P-type Ca2+ transporter type 2C